MLTQKKLKTKQVVLYILKNIQLFAVIAGYLLSSKLRHFLESKFFSCTEHLPAHNSETEIHTTEVLTFLTLSILNIIMLLSFRDAGWLLILCFA